MEATQYALFQDQSCCGDICNSMCRQFSGIMKNQIITLPPDLGTGYFRYISPCDHMKMYISDVTFFKNTMFWEEVHREAFSISFCFSDALEWGKPGQKARYRLEKGDCCIYKNGHYEMENYYEANQRYIGVGFDLHPCRFSTVTDCLIEKKAAISPAQNDSQFQKYKMTKSVESMLHQILRCNYMDRLKSLYIEGKMLELASTFANQLILEKDGTTAPRRLNASDSEALMQIRTVIEESFTEPLTIASLAKQSFMSESKLREIFRRQYGITIHQYLLDCRMEKARALLMEQNSRVKDAASFVGYSNISHFSEAFRKKYGCTPSQYVNSLSL